jgi:polyisoprenoid-binding protein YceI
MNPRAPRVPSEFAQRVALAIAAIVFAACLAAPLHAQQFTFEFDAQHTQLEFVLTGNFHDVHGTFALKHGRFILDPASGSASGQIVVDATSGDTGNSTRDRRMHKEILESEKYSEITFTPDHIEGQIPAEGEFQINVHGTFRIRGADHELLLPVQAKRDKSGIAATMQFQVPYAQWGMKNPSNFLLKVSDHVDITIHTQAKPPSASP